MLRRFKRLLRPKKRTLPWLRKENVLDTAIAFSIANNVLGDYLEFGVFEGSSFIYAYHLLKRRKADYGRARANQDLTGYLSHRPRFFAFDSFEGLPVVEQSALPIHWRGTGAMKCAQDQFTRNLRTAKVDLSEVVVIPGFYHESLTPACRLQHQLIHAAIVHVDCDLYESAVQVLDFVTPVLQDGSVLIFDDWFYYRGNPQRGEQGAFREWLGRNPHLMASELYTLYPASPWIINRHDSHSTADPSTTSKA